jgi:fermentation-respiration switch protein FrsA (DUF1100 family)
VTTLFDITYEAGTLAAQVGAESGWDTITGGANVVYDNTLLGAGLLGVKITDSGTLRKNVTATAVWRQRWYYQVPVIAPGTNVSIGVARGTTTVRAAVRHEAAGTLRLLNISATTGSSSATLVAGQKLRLEWAVDGPGGTQSLEIYRGTNSEGLTPDETLSGTFTSNTADNIGAMWATSVPGFVSLFDEVRCTDTPAVQIGPAAVFGVPTGLATTPVSSTEIDLDWNPVFEATGYDVERDAVVIALDVATNAYSDTGLSPSTTYDYRVRAVK